MTGEEGVQAFKTTKPKKKPKTNKQTKKNKQKKTERTTSFGFKNSLLLLNLPVTCLCI